jgi:hypothetical protein
MKNQIKTIAAALAMSALFSNAAVAVNKGTDTTDFVVNGVILKTDRKADAKCKLEVFHENTLIESSEIKMNKPFERKLKKNVWYTIRVTKEGYSPLLISFNTALDNGAEVLDNLFEFETALIDNETAGRMNKDLIEFPVGIVAYNKKNQKFEARHDYTSRYMAALYKTQPVEVSDVATNYSITKQADVVKDYVTVQKSAKGVC